MTSRDQYRAFETTMTRRQWKERQDMKLMGFLVVCLGLFSCFVAVATWVGVSAYGNYMMHACI